MGFRGRSDEGRVSPYLEDRAALIGQVHESNLQRRREVDASHHVHREAAGGPEVVRLSGSKRLQKPADPLAKWHLMQLQVRDRGRVANLTRVRRGMAGGLRARAAHGASAVAVVPRASACVHQVQRVPELVHARVEEWRAALECPKRGNPRVTYGRRAALVREPVRRNAARHVQDRGPREVGKRRSSACRIKLHLRELLHRVRLDRAHAVNVHVVRKVRDRRPPRAWDVDKFLEDLLIRRRPHEVRVRVRARVPEPRHAERRVPAPVRTERFNLRGVRRHDPLQSLAARDVDKERD
ncbi:hypothetical protein CEUSTIGMA_g12786.t1 [Chlamydomonas eustigma]|uniref:Uncharacterized protein n=1 Tax=Chlamydomonas eustigma TaxID=1157962 RepID=A0A250XQY9_9CHLO|nr:hypothetical protein CEUSTIGMA_g12786.t1 [Chlamydomonas eustigma]|eukprot:GAX85369.1 hypothetical protein CEUSTIGMA_g12786.t1 [Chlamydomonas eustigma]